MQERALQFTAAPRRARVFIGDVHGCVEELDALLDSFDHDPALHDVWFVGDLVNRGPHSAAAVRRAMSLRAGAVIGNHDLHALACAKGVRRLRPHDNLADLLDAADSDTLLDWLRTRPPLMVWPDVALVHAGLHPGWDDLQHVASHLDSLTEEEVDFVTRVRACGPDGRRPAKLRNGAETMAPPFAPWFDWYRGPRTVVFGHWAQRGLVVQERLRGLDTGCVYGGRLTAWIAEEDRLVSVPARRIYCSLTPS